jgi:hypothetical protein
MKVSLWLSMGILLITYGTFGWYTGNFIASLDASGEEAQSFFIEWISWPMLLVAEKVLIWLAVIGATLLLAGGLTSPLANMRSLVVRWSQSEIRAFISMLVVAIGTVFVLTWIRLALHVLVIVAATTLARLEIDREANFTKLLDFFVVGGLSLFGLGLGYFVNVVF